MATNLAIWLLYVNKLTYKLTYIFLLLRKGVHHKILEVTVHPLTYSVPFSGLW